jgi:hypothetical protein
MKPTHARKQDAHRGRPDLATMRTLQAPNLGCADNGLAGIGRQGSDVALLPSSCVTCSPAWSTDIRSTVPEHHSLQRQRPIGLQRTHSRSSFGDCRPGSLTTRGTPAFNAVASIKLRYAPRCLGKLSAAHPRPCRAAIFFSQVRSLPRTNSQLACGGRGLAWRLLPLGQRDATKCADRFAVREAVRCH